MNVSAWPDSLPDPVHAPNRRDSELGKEQLEVLQLTLTADRRLDRFPPCFARTDKLQYCDQELTWSVFPCSHHRCGGAPSGLHY